MASAELARTSEYFLFCAILTKLPSRLLIALDWSKRGQTADMSNEAKKTAYFDILKSPEEITPAQGLVENVEPENTSTDSIKESATKDETDSTSALNLADTRSPRARRWSTLDTITVKNFKAAQEAVIPVSHVTILVGPNGCGKSSEAKAIQERALKLKSFRTLSLFSGR